VRCEGEGGGELKAKRIIEIEIMGAKITPQIKNKKNA
jgi:hypothetical protein